MESMNAVPQELVVLAIVALLHPRPVIIRTDLHAILAEQQIISVAQALSDNPIVVVVCTPTLTFESLSRRIEESKGSFLILLRINHLSSSVELRLGYALMQPDSNLREILQYSGMIFTTTEPLDSVNQFLRRNILYKQDTSAIDVESVLVEPPQNGELARHRSATLNKLTRAMIDVEIIPELTRYMHDIVVFARTHRFAACGMRPQASADFELVVRTLCAIRGMSIATPMIIKDAARLTLPVHLKLVSAQDEPSLQYGGDPNLAKTWIKEWDPEVLIDFVLEQVPVPQ